MIKSIQVIGVGTVGSSIAFGLMLLNKCEDLILCDVDKNILNAQYNDLSRVRNLQEEGITSLIAVNKPQKKASVHIICAGKRWEDGLTDMELFQENFKLVEDILLKLEEGRVIIVTNPAQKLARNMIVMVQKPNLHYEFAGDKVDKTGICGKNIAKLKGYTNWGIAKEVIDMV